MPLTDTTVRQAKYIDKPRKLADEKGLYLLINQTGKYWRMDYRYQGKRKTLALGVYPDVSLAKAREKRDTARQLLATDVDPGQQKKADKATVKARTVNSFENIAHEWHRKEIARWTPAHADRIMRSLEVDAFPILGALPIDSITAPDILKALQQIEKRGATETAGRVLQRISAIIRYAIQTGRAIHNPAPDLVGVLTAQKVEHRPAMPIKEMPEFYRRLANERISPVTDIAMRLLILTFVRPGELRAARWCEFDLGNKEWRIPAERMKMRAPHIVPLSRQSIALLEKLHPITSRSEFLFPAETSLRKCMSENTLGYVMGRMGYKGIATPHGFRALASTVLNEKGFKPDVIERQLAHAERNKVRAAYHRAEYLDDRRKMMQWWADFLYELKNQ